MLLGDTHMCYSVLRSPSLEYVNVLFDVRAGFLFLSRSFTLKDKHVLLKEQEFHEILLLETHMCYSEMRSPGLEYVKVLFNDRAVFIFSLEFLLCKILTFFFWNGKIFMKCFCEKGTCVTLKWEALVWDMSKYCSTLE